MPREERMQDQSCLMGEGSVGGRSQELSHPAWGMDIMTVSNLSEEADVHRLGEGYREEGKAQERC